ncbi:fatty acid desaturase family protein [Opitutaceae bacterium LMO-CP1]|nr:fatty acid desaturase family protein [Opitutaceae bacterium LMO-M01]
MNPLLKRVAFWPRLEAVIERLTGATHRPGAACPSAESIR